MGSKCRTRTGGKSRCTGSRFGKSMQARNGAARRSFSITSPPCNVPSVHGAPEAGGGRPLPPAQGVGSAGRGPRTHARRAQERRADSHQEPRPDVSPGPVGQHCTSAARSTSHQTSTCPFLPQPHGLRLPRAGSGWDALPPLIFPSEAHLSPSLPGLTSPD